MTAHTKSRSSLFLMHFHLLPAADSRERKEGLTAICNSVIVIIAYTGELCQFAETQSAPACLLDKAGARGI